MKRKSTWSAGNAFRTVTTRSEQTARAVFFGFRYR